MWSFDNLEDVSRHPARHGRGGFCFVGVAVPVEAARAPSARGEERGGGQAGAGPAAAERSAPRLWSPLAPGPAPRSWRSIRCAPPAGPRGAWCRRRSWTMRAAPRRPEAVLGRGELGAGLQALSRRKDRARGPLGLSRADAAPGGGVICLRDRPAGTGPRRAVCGREIREGGIRALCGGSAGSCPREHVEFDAPFVRF